MHKNYFIFFFLRMLISNPDNYYYFFLRMIVRFAFRHHPQKKKEINSWFWNHHPQKKNEIIFFHFFWHTSFVVLRTTNSPIFYLEFDEFNSMGHEEFSIWAAAWIKLCFIIHYYAVRSERMLSRFEKIKFMLSFLRT